MTSDFEFQGFPKIARLSREIVVTEKIDGTNAQVFVSPDGQQILAGSRNRWLDLGDDNFGFAAWVNAHRDELLALGPGRHFGEWWGAGIQRRYGLSEKRFSLFNVQRWAPPGWPPGPKQQELPPCCSLVPIIYAGMFDTQEIEGCLERLRYNGSYAAPGFMDPEGIVVYHTAGNVGFKKTLEKDESPKTLV